MYGEYGLVTFIYYAFILAFTLIEVNKITQFIDKFIYTQEEAKYMPTEQTLAAAKNKIWSDIKVEMDRQGYTTTSLAKFLNVNRPTVSFAIHGGTTPRDVEIRKKIYRVLGME